MKKDRRMFFASPFYFKNTFSLKIVNHSTLILESIYGYYQGPRQRREAQYLNKTHTFI